jgi:L-ascorbate metabolism protein UlaG (beta-lactamase superfamily)
MTNDADRRMSEVSGEMSLRAQRLGWAGVRLELGKVTLLIDPLANEDLWGGTFVGRLIPIEISTPTVHAVVTHLHGDHFDPLALEVVMGKAGEVICAEAVATTVASRGFRVRPLRPFEPHKIGAFCVTPVPASDGFGIHQVSWVVAGAGRRLFHGGDTLWHGSWWEIGTQLGPFDVAFLPINGFRYSGRNPDVDVPSSMTPEQAAEAAAVLGAHTVVPIHYGLSTSFYREEADAEERLRAAAGRRGLAVEVLAPGEWLS